MKVTQSCLTLCDPMDYRVHGILQARILEWVAVPFSRGSSQPEIKPRSPALQADSLPAEPPGKPIYSVSPQLKAKSGLMNISTLSVQDKSISVQWWPADKLGLSSIPLLWTLFSLWSTLDIRGAELSRRLQSLFEAIVSNQLSVDLR